MLLRFQRPCEFVTLHTAAVTDADDLAEQAEDSWGAEHGHVCLIVSPQPALDVPVLVTAPARHRLLQRLPVCVQMHDLDGRIVCWQEFFDDAVCLEDVRQTMGNVWPSGSKVYLRDSTVPMDKQALEVRAGDLLRIVRPGFSVSAVTEVGAKLRRPDLYFRSLQVEGFPEVPTTPLRECLLQPLCPPQLVMYSPVSGPSLLPQVLLSHADRSLWEPRLVWPRESVADLCIVGRSIHRVAGAFPAHTTSRVPIFADTRDVGFPVQLRASYCGTMPLRAFLEAVGLSLPDLGCLDIGGTAGFDRDAQAITIKEGDVVVLRYAAGRVAERSALAAHASPVPPYDQSTDDAAPPSPAGPAVFPSRARERTPRSAKPTPGTSRSCSSMPPTTGETALASLPSSAWTASAAAFRRMQLFDLHQQLRRSVLEAVPLVYQDSPAPPPDFGEPAPAVPDDPPEDSDGSVSLDQRSEHSYLPELLSIRVAVVTLQGPTRLHSLWTQDGEDVDGFVTRAGIILNDDADFNVLLPADPQPPGPQFTMLLYPKWWRAAGIRPLLAQGASDARPPFMLAAHPHQTAEDLLPHDALVPGAASAAFAPPTTHRARVELVPEHVPAAILEDASLLYIRPEHVPVETCLPAQQQLASLEHVPRVEAEGELPIPEARLAVFLGLGFDQVCLTLEFGSVPRFVARQFGIPVEHVYILRQRHCFAQLTVAGRRPAHCFGFRNLADMQRPFRGLGLFLDPRPVGRPVCFREVFEPELTPSQLCTWLGIQVPDGYAACCVCGDLQRSRLEPFTPTHGCSVLLWLDSAEPSLALLSPTTTSCDEDVAAEDLETAAAPETARPSRTAQSPPPVGAGCRRDRSRTPPRSTMCFAMACGPHKWRDGTTLHTAEPTCPRRLTPVESVLPVAPSPARPVRQKGSVLTPSWLPSSGQHRPSTSDDHVWQHPRISGIGKACSSPLPPVPTPCRSSTVLPALCQAPCEPLQDHQQAVSGTLSDLPPAPLQDDTLSSISSCLPSRGVTLSLADSLPVSVPQAQALEVMHILRERAVCCDPRPEDWLDADLSGVAASPHASPEIRWRLKDVVPFWGSEAVSAEDSVLIFTDGSFRTHSRGRTGQCAWAFSVWLVGPTGERYVGHAAHGSVPPDTPYWLGERSEDACTAEQLALAWALAWVLDRGVAYGRPVIFAYDNTSAGGGAFGASMPPGTDSALRTTALSSLITSLRHCLETLTSVCHRHVRAHQGVLGNEIVDILAKDAAQCSVSITERCLPTWPSRLAGHALHSWAWMALNRRGDLPSLFALPSEAHRLQASGQRVLPPAGHREPTVRLEGKLEVRLRLLTYNVLTLLTPGGPSSKRDNAAAGMRMFGKRDLLKQQLIQAQVHCAALQETRLPGSQELPDDEFYMWHASCTDTGQYGMALWLRKALPFHWLDGKALYVDRSQATVLLASPRLLILQLSGPAFRCVLVAAHAPHTPAHGRCDEAVAFWGEVTKVLRGVPATTAVIVLTDANSHLGEVESSAVGDLAPETENASGVAFHCFLQEHDLAAANTFSQCHSGSHATWCSAQGGLRRLDYVALPVSWLPGVRTSVLPRFELLQTRDDHFPLLADCSLQRVLRLGAYRLPARRVAMRPDPVKHPSEAAAFARLLAQQPAISWSADVEQHHSAWVAAHNHAWQQVRSPPQHKPRQPYLSQASLELVRQRQAYRKYVSHETKEWQRRLLVVGFAAFFLHCAGGTFSHSMLCIVGHWLAELDISIARAMRFLQVTGRRIRSLVRSDRLAYLDSLKDQLAKQELKNSRELYFALRRVFPQARSSRQSGVTPLPQVQLLDGTFATTQELRQRRWGDYFAELEAGYSATAPEYCDGLRAQKQGRLAAGSSSPLFDWGALPDLAETERLILSARVRKAVGEDGIAAEMLKLDTVRSARFLFPLFTKAATALHEPVAYRGGELMVLAKKAGATFRCEDYRAILLSSSSGKLYHKFLRGRLGHLLQDTRTELQCGAAPGCGVEALSLLARVVQNLAHAERRSWALMLFDIRSAFYRVVRQLVVAVPDTDAALLRVISTLGLPGEAVQELHSKLRSLAALSEARAGDHLAALVSDILQGTYFRLQHSDLLYITKRGTRPGDPCADVLFAFLLAGYVKQLEVRLERDGLAEELPPLQSEPLFRQCHVPRTLGCISWADDCLRAATAPTLPAVISRTAAIMQRSIEMATALGIAFSYSPAKTCVLLPPCRSPVAHLLADGPPGVPEAISVPNSLDGTFVQVPVVDAYKHLGCVLVADRMPGPEIRYRLAQAQSVSRPLAFRFFANSRYPLDVRRSILRSLAVSKFVHGSVALCLDVGVHYRRWCNSYISLWRTLCKREPGSQKLLHAYEVLALAKAVSPPLALAYSRAIFLQRHALQGPTTLLVYLQAHWEKSGCKSWLHQLLLDIRHVSALVPGARVLQDSPCPIRALFDSFVDAPHWWVNCVRTAHRRFMAELGEWMRRPAAEGSVSCASQTSLPFTCPLCSAGFTLRRYLCSHLAKRHQCFSPVRHYAPAKHCLACLRMYGSVQAVQNHLRRSDHCLTRLAHAVAPMTAEEIHRAERDADGGRRSVAKGRWQAYVKTGPVLQMYGPPHPVFQDRFPPDSEDVPLDAFRRFYKPTVTVLQWIDAYHQERSVILHVPEAKGFWTERPSQGAHRPGRYAQALFHHSA